MSSMLEQAIIDASQLKEAAQKNAEEVVIEKYQDEIRSAVETILEQEEAEEPFGLEGGETAEMMPADDGSLAFVEDLPPAQKSEMDEVVTIDLDKLEEMMAEEMEEGTLEASDMVSREAVAEEIDAILNEDEIELDEQSLREFLADEEIDLSPLVEDFVEDSTKEEDAEAAEEEAEKAGGQTGAVYKGVSESTHNDDNDDDDDLTPPEAVREPKSGHPGELGSEETAYKRDSKKKKKAPKTGGEQAGGGGYYDYSWRKMKLEENKALIKEQKKTTQKVQLLEEKLNKYGTITTQLKNKLEESNLVNARLLYQNRVLNSVSLNERQKDRIVEAISNAKSVEEARIVFETLQSAVGSLSKRKRPESLNEVVSRSSSAFIPRKEETKKDSSFADRMRTLAGIKKE